MQENQLPIVLFDGSCGFCAWCVHIAHSRVRADAIYLPYQLADLPSLGVALHDAQRSVHFVDGSQVLRSSEAVRAILRLGTPLYQGMAWVMGLPGVRGLIERGYWFVAKHRGKLPGLPAPLTTAPSDKDGHENL